MKNLFVADIATTVHKLGEIITSRKIILESDAVFEFGSSNTKVLSGKKPDHSPEDLRDIAEAKIPYMCNVRTLSQAPTEIQEKVLERQQI